MNERGRQGSARYGAALIVAALLGGCAQQAEPPAPEPAPVPPVAAADQWSTFALPGKKATRYLHTRLDGRAVIRAQADASASMYRQRLVIDPDKLGTIDFSWWVPALMSKADLTNREAADSPVRVVLAFDGDVAKLSRKNRMLFELAETLSGEPPPYATLMYVWDNRSAVETVIPAARSDRIRKIVVDSGPAQLKAWRHHRRDIVRDFERAFGERPGRLLGVALMTDSDNTASRAQGIYGELVLTNREGAVVRQLNE